MEEKHDCNKRTENLLFDFDCPKNVDENLKQEIEFIIKSNESLAENNIKRRLNNYCLNISMETQSMNTENSKQMNLINLFLTCH